MTTGTTQQMSDLELTQACAEAMGLKLLRAYGRDDLRYAGEGWNGLMFSRDPHPCLFIDSGAYNPLQNDEQAMALVKHLHLDIYYAARTDLWSASFARSGARRDRSLNRAICECVALRKMVPA